MLKGRWLAGVLVLLGVVLLAGGWWTADYLSAVLLNIGTALLLFAPLLYLQRLVEQRVIRVQKATSASVSALSSQVADVQRQVGEASARLDDLTNATRDRLNRAQERDAQAFAAFEEAPARDVLLTLLVRALDLRAIDKAGVRVRVPGTSSRLRFVAMTGKDENGEAVSALIARVEGLDGLQKGRVEWLPGQPADSFMAEVATELQKCGLFHPGSFDATKILERLMETLRVAIEGRTGLAGYSDLEPIVEVPNDQWIIMTNGLIAPRSGYFIPAGRLLEDGFFDHVREKTWVDYDKLEEAWSAAAALEQERNRVPF